MRHLIALNSLNFSKVTDLYARWEYAAKQTKKVAALHALKIKTHSAGIACEGGTEEVSTRRAFTNISELVDGMRVWHYKRGEGMLVWHFEVGREDKQYPLNGFRRVPRQIKNTRDAGRERVDQLNELMAQ